MRLQLVRRALDTTTSAIQHVRVHHRRAHVGVAQQLLDRADVAARLEQVGRERVTKRVRAHALGEARRPRGHRDRPLYRALVQMEAGGCTVFRVFAYSRSGKHKMPRPLGGGIRILSMESLG